MEGNFSRGHRPDAKRGRAYRRVLVKQGAALLDSDLAAMVDATDQSLRRVLGHVTCAAGSPDLGFLVTPGQLLALFDPVRGAVPAVTAPAEAVRDFSRKYLDRLPGLRISGPGGSISVPLRATLAAGTMCRLWVRADAAANAVIGGAARAIPASAAYVPIEVPVTGATLSFAPTATPYWVALIETRADAGAQAVLHWAAGSYQVGGLPLATPGARWPGLAGPAGTELAAASALPAGTRLTAYLEASERHITSVEDPGVLEQALGGDHDTTTRTVVRGQVKLAVTPNAATPEEIAAWVASPALPTGRVILGVAGAQAAADPCDLPVPGGYSGPDNRLYRLAVHAVTPGAGGETLFKWSRDNASDLFAVSLQPALPAGSPVSAIRARADLPLRAGDLVELLSEAVDMGDSAPGTLGAAGLVRPARRQGRLFRLDGGDVVSGSTRDFTLRDPLTEALVAPFPPAPFGAEGIKLRLWSGLIRRSGTGNLTAPLEHGIEAAISGQFEPGDWWQYEARVLAANANGPAPGTPPGEPHGPERLFAPLALLEQVSGAPMLLRAWLDTRHAPLCDTQADGVAYDGARAGTPSDTVQEALDELFLRVSDGCGELAVPLNGSIQAVVDSIPPGGSARICLNAGTRDLGAAISVTGKGDLVIGGIGPGSLLRIQGRQVIRFSNCRSVDLRDFAVEARAGGGAAVLEFVDCGEVRIGPLRLRAAGPAPEAAAIRISAPNGTTRLVSIRNCTLSLGAGDSGILVIDPGHAEIADNEITIRPEPYDFVTDLQNPATAAALGSVLLDRIHFHADDGGFDFMSSVLEFTPPLGTALFARNGIAMGSGIWGRSTLSFSTFRSLGATEWEELAAANPSPSVGGTDDAAMEGFLRRFRTALGRRIFGVATGFTATIPASVNGSFGLLREHVQETNEVIHGAAGVVVALTRGPRRSPGNREPIAALYNETAVDGQTVSIAGNRIAGFVQGIRVGASRGGKDRSNLIFAQSVEICGNRIRLRLPTQARQRHGIFIGNSLSARVVANRVEDPLYRPREVSGGIAIDADGIRLFGHYGPLVEVAGNLTHGTSVGIRLHSRTSAALQQQRAQDRFVAAVRDNAYSGDGVAEVFS
jgi:hypothetical protein